MKLVARIIMTAALLVGVYRETGPWTTLFAVLVFVALELRARALKKIMAALK